MASEDRSQVVLAYEVPRTPCCLQEVAHNSQDHARLLTDSLIARYVFSLRYIIGGEFFSHLRKAGRFSNDESCFYAAEIALVFEHLHCALPFVATESPPCPLA